MDDRTQWRGQPDTNGRRRIAKLLLISILVHLPLTPVLGLLGLFTLLPARDQPTEDLGQLRALPIEMFDLDPGGAGAERTAEQSTAADDVPEVVMVEAVEPTPPKPKLVKPEEPPDAGAPEDAGDASPDDPADGSPEAVAVADAEVDAGSAGSGEGIGDPIAALRGPASKVVDANANVKITIYNENIRGHALGPRIGHLLSRIGQWRDFFGPAAINPVRDVDRMLIVGPQLRDSSQVAVVLSYKEAREQRIREAIDALVRRDPDGKWRSAQVAEAKADRARRVFVMPRPGMVIVTPPSAAEQVIALGPKAAIAAALKGEAVVASVLTPWRVLLGASAVGLSINIPESIKTIKKASAKLTPAEDGGVVAIFEAVDDSEEQARRNAKDVERTIKYLSQPGFGLRFLDRIEFHARGDKIYGTITANSGQVAFLFSLIEQSLVPKVSTLPGDAAKGPR